jgi:hypothetical protein
MICYLEVGQVNKGSVPPAGETTHHFHHYSTLHPSYFCAANEIPRKACFPHTRIEVAVSPEAWAGCFDKKSKVP